MKAASGVLGEDLAWLAEVLWPDPRVEVSLAPSAAPGARRVLRYRIAPSARRPRLLVPDRVGGGAAFSVFNDAMTQAARLRKRSAGLAYDLGPGRWALDRLGVDVPADLPSEDTVDLLVERRLGRALGWPAALVSVSFGSPRPSRKPVLQLAVPGRGVAAFAKVAWNPLTSALVRNEGAILRWLGQMHPRSFVAPRPIHEERWNERDIVVTTALPTALVRRGALHAWPDPEVVLEIARLGGELTAMPLTETPMWRDLLARARSLEPALDGILTDLETALARIEAPVGRWHGDWGPWNMTRLPDGRVALWDWERSRDGVPLGADAAHFAIQVGLRRTGGRGPAACRYALDRLLTYLPQLGVRPQATPGILALYLIELTTRHEEAVAAGALPPHHTGRLAALAALEEVRGGLR